MFKVDRIHFELASGQWLGLFYQLDGYENMTVLDLGIFPTHDLCHDWFDWCEEVRPWRGYEGVTPTYSFVPVHEFVEKVRTKRKPRTLADILSDLIGAEVAVRVVKKDD